MEDINLQTLRGMWFQHDGVPAHCAGVVRDYSNERFFRWIGRKTNIFSFIVKFPQKLWICMTNVSDNFNAEFYVLPEYAMKNITFHLKKTKLTFI